MSDGFVKTLIALSVAERFNPLIILRRVVERAQIKLMEDVDSERQKAFARLKPLCTALMATREVSMQMKEIESISKALQEIHQPDIVLNESLLQYIFFPLSHILRTELDGRKNDLLLEKVFQCLLLLIDNSWYQFMTPSLLQQLLTMYTVLLGGSPALKTPASSLSENTKAVASRSILCLLQKCRSPELIALMRSIPFRGIFGHLVTVTLHIAVTEQLLDLRSDSLGILRTLFAEWIVDADILAMILPGTVSQIIKVLLAKPNKESRVILTKAFDVLDTVLRLTLSDSLNLSLITVVTSLEDLAVSKIPVKTQSQSKYSESRSEAWLNATKGQLGAGLGSLLPLRSHPKPSIRKQYAVLAGDIVTLCAGTLDNCTGTMLELLILFYNDEDEAVANVSRSYLKKVAASKSATKASSHLKASLRAWFVAFPRIMYRGDENRKQDIISQIKAAVEILGSRIQVTFASAIDTFAYGWLNALRLQPSDLSYSKERLLELEFNNDQGPSSFPPVRLYHTHSLKTTQMIKDMVGALGSNGDLPFLVTYFMKIAKRRPALAFESQPSAAMWIVNELLRDGSPGRDLVKDVSSTIADILTDQTIDTDTDADDNDIPDESKLDAANGVVSTLLSEKLKKPSAAQLNEQQTLRICLCLQTFANCSKILGPAFRVELIDVLYPVLSFLGDSNAFLQETAMTCLEHIAINCNYPSTELMVYENADYIINGISQRLAFAELHPNATSVLRAMIRLVGEPIVPLLEDSIQEVFDALDKYHGYDVLVDAFVGVLVDVVKVMPIEEGHVAGALPRRPEFDIDATQKLIKGGNANVTPEIESFLTWFASRKSTKGDDLFVPHPKTASMKDTSEEVEPSRPKDPVDTPPTRGQSLTIAIIKRAQYFITHSSPLLRARIIELVKLGIPVLASRQSDILPLINKIWPFVLNRLGDREMYIVTNAAGLISAAGQHCGDFMSQRILSDAWPKFRDLLQKQAIDDSKSAIATKSQFSMSLTLSKSIMETMTRIVLTVPLEEKLLWEIGMTFGKSIDRPNLEQHVMQLYTAIKKVNADMVWLLLSAFQDGGEQVVAVEPLKTYKLPVYQHRKDIGNLKVLL